MQVIKKAIRRWLGIVCYDSSFDDIDHRLVCLEKNQTQLLADIGKLKDRWVAQGPGKIDVATTSGYKKVLEPTYHSAQSLLDLILKKRKK
jgi:hypothetical protein